MQFFQVVHTDVTDGATIKVRLPCGTHQRRISAVTRTVDADAGRIGNLLLDRPARGIGDVVLHATTPFPSAGASERRTVIARATEVDAQYGIAGLGQQLRIVVE